MKTMDFLPVAIRGNRLNRLVRLGISVVLRDPVTAQRVFQQIIEQERIAAQQEKVWPIVYQKMTQTLIIRLEVEADESGLNFFLPDRLILPKELDLLGYLKIDRRFSTKVFRKIINGGNFPKLQELDLNIEDQAFTRNFPLGDLVITFTNETECLEGRLLFNQKVAGIITAKLVIDRRQPLVSKQQIFGRLLAKTLADSPADEPPAEPKKLAAMRAHNESLKRRQNSRRTTSAA